MKSNWPTKELQDLALQSVLAYMSSEAMSVIPSDIEDWGGFNGSKPRFYAELLGALAKFESNYKTKTTFTETQRDRQGKRVISRGLLQLSIESANSYGAKLKDAQELHDPATNLKAGVLIMSRWIARHKVIAGGKTNAWKGMAMYWSPFRKPDRVASMKAAMKKLDPVDILPMPAPKPTPAPTKTIYQRAYEIAKSEMGVAEVKGTSHNKRVLEYHKCTSLRATTDETPWCASFANWVLKQMGEQGTNSAAAKSFAKWGAPLAKPVKGCIAVFTRDGGGHVAFFDHEDEKYVYTLGGNQGNRVCIAAYPKSRLLGYRGFAA